MSTKDLNMSSPPTTLIIGAGIMGTSTAYHLAQVVDPSSITIIDRHPFPVPDATDPSPPLGASHDINKIVRADYSVPFYMSLAQEAISVWKTSEVLQSYYYQTGWIMLAEEGVDTAAKIRQNFRECGEKDVTKDMSFEEVKSNWEGVLHDVDLQGYETAYYNPGAGWAEADKAVGALLGEAIKNGVKYHQGKVIEVLLGDTGRGVQGVKLADGKVVKADRVVLASGAWTSKIMTGLEDKLGLPEEQRLESQVKAAGVCCVHFSLDDNDMKYFSQMPVIIYGENGEVLPPPPSKLLKFTNAHTFCNTITTPTGQRITAPISESQKKVPEKLKAETMEIVRRIMPSMADAESKISYWRICWDSITPKQHQLITRHPDERLSNLSLAVGGSFHSWKFLPTIGKYVANVVCGHSNGIEKDQNWAWKNKGWADSDGGGAHEKVIPRRELSDLGGGEIRNASRMKR